MDEIDGAIATIASAAQQQATGLSEISIALNDMDRVVQQNAAMVETTAATHALLIESDDLASLISRFKIAADRPQAEPLPISMSRSSVRAPVVVTQKALAAALRTA